MSKLLPITAAIVLGLPAVASAADVVAVHCGHVFDAANAKLLGEHTVVIDGNRIRDVQPGNVTLDGAQAIDLGRSEGRRVGKGWVSTGRSRWVTYHSNKKKIHIRKRQ